MFRSTFLCLSLACFFQITTGFGQEPTTIDSLRYGDEVVFSNEADAKRFVVIGRDKETFSCSILNEEGKLDTVVIRKAAIVQAYKNSLNRKRLSVFQPGVKLRWKQGGKRVEGFLKSYNPADPDLTVDVYLSNRLEERRVPAQYATPTFEESMADTLLALCNLWEAPKELFSFSQDEDAEQGIPKMESIDLKQTEMLETTQYVMEDYKFAMVSSDNLNSGIVGTWREQDELMEKWRQIEEAKKEKARMEKEMADLAQREKEMENGVGATNRPPDAVRIDSAPGTANQQSEMDMLKAEIEALKKEMAKMKAEMKEQHGGGL